MHAGTWWLGELVSVEQSYWLSVSVQVPGLGTVVKSHSNRVGEGFNSRTIWKFVSYRLSLHPPVLLLCNNSRHLLAFIFLRPKFPPVAFEFLLCLKCFIAFLFSHFGVVFCAAPTPRSMLWIASNGTGDIIRSLYSYLSFLLHTLVWGPDRGSPMALSTARHIPGSHVRMAPSASLSAQLTIWGHMISGEMLERNLSVSTLRCSCFPGVAISQEHRYRACC